MDLRQVWKRLRARLPIYKALADIEARLLIVEQRDGIRPTPPNTSPACPVCGVGTLRYVGEEPHPMLGRAGITTDTLRCDNEACHHVAVRPR
jgi:hypothetical protein